MNENDPSTKFLALEEFMHFRNALKSDLKVPLEIEASIGKGWESGIGPDQGVGDTQNQGLLTDGGFGEKILDTEASGTKEYLMGLDIGFGDSCCMLAHCHRDEKGELVIDRTECVSHDHANQGL